MTNTKQNHRIHTDAEGERSLKKSSTGTFQCAFVKSIPTSMWVKRREGKAIGLISGITRTDTGNSSRKNSNETGLRLSLDLTKKEPRTPYAFRRAPSGTWAFESDRANLSIGQTTAKVNKDAANTEIVQLSATGFRTRLNHLMMCSRVTPKLVGRKRASPFG